MSKELPFLIYCIQMYRNAKNMAPNEVIALFSKYQIMEYIVSVFDALHTTGKEYIVQDIDMFIASRQSL